MRTKLLHSYTCLPARQVARLLKKKQYNNLTIYQSKRAFTLIELLVVIALIGILTSFGVYGFQSSQKKARDAQRKSDLVQVKKALEAAKNDCLGGTYYPVDSSGGALAFSLRFINTQVLLTNSNLKYLNSSMVDPKNTILYRYTQGNFTETPNVCPDNSGSMTVSGTKNFTLQAKLESKGDPDSPNSVTKCYAQSNWNSTTTAANAQGYYYYVCND